MFAYLKSGNTVEQKYADLKNEQLDSIPDDELENAVTEWLFAKVDSKATTEVPIVRAMPKVCRYVYAAYIVSGEVTSRGFGECFMYIDSYLLSSAIEGFIDMGVNELASITEEACKIAGDFINKKGRNNIASLAEDKELAILSEKFGTSNDFINLSETFVKYIKANKEYFGE